MSVARSDPSKPHFVELRGAEGIFIERDNVAVAFTTIVVWLHRHHDTTAQRSALPSQPVNMHHVYTWTCKRRQAVEKHRSISVVKCEGRKKKGF